MRMYKIYYCYYQAFLDRKRLYIRAMKLCIFFTFIFVVQAGAAALAQRVSLREEKAPLEKVLNDIHKQTGFDFFYDDDLLAKAPAVTVELKDVPLEQALRVVLGDGLTYSVSDKTITVKEAAAADKLKAQLKTELAQVTVTGKVTDELGNPMPGVTVREKDIPTNGVQTNEKGRFTISVPNELTTLIFSYIGYESLEIKAHDIGPAGVIVMTAISTNLKEVVINKGYYDEKRELSTGDVGVVSAKTIEEQPVSDPIEALNGRVAGLNIQQTSGLPGSYDKIQIRGQNSIANGNDPLYVIDGVPFSSVSLTDSHFGGGAVGKPNITASQINLPANTNGQGISPFNALNPADIENIEVLKDADATAIYGSRGANGVILITTKKGKAGDAKVTFNLQQGIGQVAHYMDLLNTQQYLQVRHQAFANDGLPFPSIQTDPSDYNYDVNGVWDTTKYTNWQKVLMGGTAQYTDAQASVSGGTTNTQFLVGAGYNRQTTVFPNPEGNSDRKASLHFSINHTSTNQKFKMLLSASYTNDNSNLPGSDPITQLTNLVPDAPSLYLRSGSLNWEIYQGTNTFNNPLGYLLQSATAVTNNLVSSMTLSYQIFPGLTLESRFGYNHDEMNANLLYPSDSYPPPYNISANSSNETSNAVNQTWIIEPSMTYTKKISKGSLELLLGTTLQQNTSTSISYAASGFSSDALIDNPVAATYNGIQFYNDILYRYSAVYGRLGYNWESKYLINLTARRDGSSRFGPGHQFGNFGSAGLGWIFSKENFITNNLPWLSFGKLRASYGSKGNDQMVDYQYLSTYTPQSITYVGTPGLKPTGLTNPDFHWETIKSAEIGMELGFLQDRIHGDFSYYRNRTSDQLVGEPLPYIAGFTSIQYNLPATIQNSGLETNLNTINVKSKDFSWSSNVNFTLPYNKLVSFDNFASSNYRNVYQIGKSIFGTYVYQMTGVNPQTGVYTYATANANGIPSRSDEIFSQPITAKFYGGLSNTFSFRGFSLDIFIQFKKQTAYNYLHYFGAGAGQFETNEPVQILNAWKQPGDVSPIGKFSTTGAEDPLGLFNGSDAVIGDASFIRLKNVSLSYSLPRSWQQWAHASNARIFVQGQNLYTFTHYIGLDPDTPGFGTPEIRVLTAGVNASF